MVSSFPENVQNWLNQRNNQLNTVLVASSVCIDGIKYSADMVISVGTCAGLPDFRQIAKIVVINTDIAFVCRLMTSWYDEHLRVYDLCHSHLPTFSVTQLSELNFLCHFTEFMANSLLHSNGTYYAEWIKPQNVACLR